MSRSRVTLGEIGENLACAELERRGYAILARRYRSRLGEIDIVALEGRTVVFVEVKTRDGAGFGSGADAVTWSKRRRIAAIATEFLARYRLLERPCRFDVVSIGLAQEGPEIEVYTSAFDAGGGGFPR
jgi:putative endonuclease